MSSLTSKLSKVGNAIKKAVVKIGKIALSAVKTAISSVEKVISKLFSSLTALRKKIRVGLAAVGVGLITLGKQASDVAKDLVEVQNVVDVAFGKSASRVNEFAENAIKQFGMSELSAKSIASEFKAISNSMAIADETGTNMALNLTGLAADIASFWNTDIESAANALQGVYTDNWRALKQYGVLLDETTLGEYALSKGIKKKISDMTQAEKVMLRYEYVMQATADAQGDFARTSGTWANQLKLLKEQWTQFLGILGKAVTQVFAPVLQALNNILAAAITLAKTLLGMVGIDFEVLPAAVSSAAGDVGGLADDMADADGSAKDIAKTLSGFDELNLLKGKDSGGGSGAGGGGNGDSDLAITPPEVNTKEMGDNTIGSFKEWLLRIDDWFNNELAPKMKGWGSKLAEWMNEGIEKTPWAEIGQTLADGLDVVIGFFDSFWTDLDGTSIGNGFGTLFNNFVNNFDWEQWAHKISEKIKTCLETAIGFIKTIDWTNLGAKIALWFETLDWKKIAEDLGTLLNDTIIAALDFAIALLKGTDGAKFTESIETFLGAFEGETIKTKFGELVEELKKQWQEMLSFNDGDNIFGSLKTSIEDLDEAVKKLRNSIILLSTAFAAIKIVDMLSMLGTGHKAFTNFKNVIISESGSIKTAFASAFGGIADGLKVFPQLFEGIGSGLSSLGSKIAAFATGPVGIIIGAITAAVACIISAYRNNEAFRAQVDSLWNDNLKPFFDNLVSFWQTNIKPMLEAVWGVIESLWGLIKQFATWVGTVLGELLLPVAQEIIAKVQEIWNKFSWFFGILTSTFKSLFDTFKQIIDDITLMFKGLTDFLTGIFTGDWDLAWTGLGEIFQGFGSLIGDIVSAVMDVLQGVADFIVGAFKFAWDNTIGALIEKLKGFRDKIKEFFGDVVKFFKGGFKEDIKNAMDKVGSVFSEAWDKILQKFKEPINKAIGILNTFLGAIASAVNSVIGAVNKISINIPDWVPVWGGKTLGFSLSYVGPWQIPLLAQGGVITDPTMAMVGEYAGAKSNPEIVTPENIMAEVFSSQLEDLIPILTQQFTRVVSAIDNKDLDVRLGDDAIAASAQRGNKNYYRRTGQPLFSF